MLHRNVFRRERQRSGQEGVPALSAKSLSVVVEEQGAHIPAEWLLVLGGLLRGCPGSSDDLGVSRALLHRC